MIIVTMTYFRESTRFSRNPTQQFYPPLGLLFVECGLVLKMQIYQYVKSVSIIIIIIITIIITIIIIICQF